MCRSREKGKAPELAIMRAIIAGGGTGGHLFPGIAVAREIQRRDRNAEILFVGSERGIEARLAPQEGFSLRCLPAGSMKGVGWGARVRNLAATVKGILGAKRILKEFRPSIVIGVGGYASFPMVSAAILKAYPRIIMEQNAVPGLANRVLGRWVDFAAVTDPGTSSYFGRRAVVTGNPIRPQFKSIPPKRHESPYEILVFGGSQGAQSINKAVRESVPLLSDWKQRLRFTHQTGEAQLNEVRQAYEAFGFEADVRPFFNDFHQKYAAADLIVSRAGATTVAEIKAAGRAAILIPFPYAADDHQTRNAQAMVAEGAAVMLRNADLTGESLAGAIRSLLSDVNRLEGMERNAKRIAVLDAEERIVDLAEKAVERRRRGFGKSGPDHSFPYFPRRGK
jgi:UDP-N-acetylglucosamine--N-acetylmuramyl-(pentapeptide) pyrophosphoryl-undecaprenol N-acetylglucosamine transferase